METGTKGLSHTRSLSKKLTAQRFGKFRERVRNILPDRRDRVKDQESSVSSNQNTDGMDVSTVGTRRSSSSSSSSAGSEDGPSLRHVKKRKSEHFTDPFSTKKMKQREVQVDGSSDSSSRSKGKRKSNGGAADISPEKVPSRKRFDLTRILSSGRERNSNPNSKRNRLQLLLRRNHGKGSSKLEQIPSDLSVDAGPFVVSEEDFIGRYSNFSAVSESPADLEHVVNLYYRGKDDSPNALAVSLSEAGKLVSQLSGISLRSIPKLSRFELDELATKLPPDSKLSRSDLDVLANKVAQELQSTDGDTYDAEGLWSCRNCGWTCQKSDSSAEERQRHEEHCDDIMKVQQWLGTQAPLGKGWPHAPEQDADVEMEIPLHNQDSGASFANIDSLDDVNLEESMKIADATSNHRDNGQARKSFDYHEMPNHMKAAESEAKEKMDPSLGNGDDSTRTMVQEKSTDHGIMEDQPTADIERRHFNGDQKITPNELDVIHESRVHGNGPAEDNSSVSSGIEARPNKSLENQRSLPHELGSARRSLEVADKDISSQWEGTEGNRLHLETQGNDTATPVADPLDRVASAESAASESAASESTASNSEGGPSEKLEGPVIWDRGQDSFTDAQEEIHDESSHKPVAATTREGLPQQNSAPESVDLDVDRSDEHLADKHEDLAAADGEGAEEKNFEEGKRHESSGVRAEECEEVMPEDTGGVNGQVWDESQTTDSSKSHAEKDESSIDEEDTEVKPELGDKEMAFGDETREQEQLEVSGWSYPTAFDQSEEELRVGSPRDSITSDAEHKGDQTGASASEEMIPVDESPAIQLEHEEAEAIVGSSPKEVVDDGEGHVMDSTHPEQRTHEGPERTKSSTSDVSASTEMQMEEKTVDHFSHGHQAFPWSYASAFDQSKEELRVGSPLDSITSDAEHKGDQTGASASEEVIPVDEAPAIQFEHEEAEATVGSGPKEVVDDGEDHVIDSTHPEQRTHEGPERIESSTSDVSASTEMQMEEKTVDHFSHGGQAFPWSYPSAFDQSKEELRVGSSRDSVTSDAEHKGDQTGASASEDVIPVDEAPAIQFEYKEAEAIVGSGPKEVVDDGEDHVMDSTHPEQRTHEGPERTKSSTSDVSASKEMQMEENTVDHFSHGHQAFPGSYASAFDKSEEELRVGSTRDSVTSDAEHKGDQTGASASEEVIPVDEAPAIQFEHEEAEAIVGSGPKEVVDDGEDHVMDSTHPEQRTHEGPERTKSSTSDVSASTDMQMEEKTVDHFSHGGQAFPLQNDQEGVQQLSSLRPTVHTSPRRSDSAPGSALAIYAQDIRQDAHDPVNAPPNLPKARTLRSSRTASLPATSGRGKTGQSRRRKGPSMQNIFSAFQNLMNKRGPSTTAPDNSTQSTSGPEDIRDSTLPSDGVRDDMDEKKQSTGLADIPDESASDGSSHQPGAAGDLNDETQRAGQEGIRNAFELSNYEQEPVRDPQDKALRAELADIHEDGASESGFHQLDAVRDTDDKLSSEPEGVDEDGASETGTHQFNAVRDTDGQIPIAEPADRHEGGSSESGAHQFNAVRDTDGQIPISEPADRHEGGSSESGAHPLDGLRDVDSRVISADRGGSAFESSFHQSDDVADEQNRTQSTGSEENREGSFSDLSMHQPDDVADEQNRTQSTGSEENRERSFSDLPIHQPDDVADEQDWTKGTGSEYNRKGSARDFSTHQPHDVADEQDRTKATGTEENCEEGASDLSTHQPDDVTDEQDWTQGTGSEYNRKGSTCDFSTHQPHDVADEQDRTKAIGTEENREEGASDLSTQQPDDVADEQDRTQGTGSEYNRKGSACDFSTYQSDDVADEQDRTKATGIEENREGSASDLSIHHLDGIADEQYRAKGTKSEENREGSASDLSAHQPDDVADERNRAQGTGYEEIGEARAADFSNHQPDDVEVEPDRTQATGSAEIRELSAPESSIDQSDAALDLKDTTGGTGPDELREGTSREFSGQQLDVVRHEPHKAQSTEPEDISGKSAPEFATRQFDAVRDDHGETQGTLSQDIPETSDSPASVSGANADTDDRAKGIFSCLPLDFAWASSGNEQVSQGNTAHDKEAGLGVDSVGEPTNEQGVVSAEQKHTGSKNCLSILVEALSTFFVDNSSSRKPLPSPASSTITS